MEELKYKMPWFKNKIKFRINWIFINPTIKIWLEKMRFARWWFMNTKFNNNKILQ